MEKVFVLNYLCDPTDDMSNACVCGVYNTLDEAQKAMKEEFNERLTDILQYYEVENEEELEDFDDVNISKYDREYTIYDCGNCDEWTISEWDI